jgi:hypothetical protein
VVSRSVYDNNPNNVQVGQILPPNCAATTGGCGASSGAPYNGAYPSVWNNGTYDAGFGITSKIYLDQMFPFGFVLNSLEVPNSSQRGIKSTSVKWLPASARSPNWRSTSRPTAGT